MGTTTVAAGNGTSQQGGGVVGGGGISAPADFAQIVGDPSNNAALAVYLSNLPTNAQQMASITAAVTSLVGGIDGGTATGEGGNFDGGAA